MKNGSERLRKIPIANLRAQRRAVTGYVETPEKRVDFSIDQKRGTFDVRFSSRPDNISIGIRGHGSRAPLASAESLAATAGDLFAAACGDFPFDLDKLARLAAGPCKVVLVTGKDNPKALRKKCAQLAKRKGGRTWP